MKRISKGFMMVLAFMIFMSPVLLQAQITTGTLRGFVVDENGEPLPGAAVEIESATMMGKRSAMTDARGFYRFLYLPPGKFTICVQLEAFETCWMRGVTVQVAQTSTANVTLKMGELEETIEVTAEAPVIDTESSSRSYNITKEMIETVPLAPRMNYNAAWIALPGVSGWYQESPLVNAGMINRDIEPGVSYMFGPLHGNDDDSYENKIQIDGMDINDSMSGRNYFRLNNEAVQEMDIKTAGASAEYGNARSAFMNVITKTGGNQFEGAVLFQYQPKSFVTTNIEGATSKSESYAIPSITLSGPIIKDKLWFLASYKYDNLDYQYPNTQIEDLFQKTRSHMPFLKLTYQVHDNHTLSFVFTNDYQEMSGYDYPDETISTAATSQTYYQGGPMFSVTWRWIITDSMYFNFVAGYNVKPRDYTADIKEPRLRYTDRYSGTTIYYDQAYGEDYYSTRDNVLVSGDLTWFKDDLWNTGSHEIKFGVEIRPYSYVERTRTYNEDEYGFYRYTLGLDYADYGLSEPYIWRAYDRFPGNEYINEYVTTNESVYLRDNWVISKNLTLSIGLRWEHSKMDMWHREELPAFMDEISPLIRENVMFSDSGLAPRLGLTYNVENIGVFKFHLGRYLEHLGGSVGQYPRVIGQNQYRMDKADLGKGAEALKIYSEGALNYAAHYNSPDLELAYNDEFVVSFERELFGNLALETSFIYKSTQSHCVQEINAIFENGQFVGRMWPDFDDIDVRTTYHGDERKAEWIYKGLQFNLKRNFVERWGLMLNYTYMWRDYNKLGWIPGELDQFVYANPDDLTMKNYGIRWSAKASFFYRLPGDFMFSTFVWGQSGMYYNDKTGDYGRTESAPRVYLSNGRRVSDIVWSANNSYYVGRKFGEQGRTTDSLWSINVRLSKGINISRFRAELSVDVFNLFNSATYTSFYTLDVRHPRYDEQSNPQAPRSAQVNMRLKF